MKTATPIIYPRVHSMKEWRELQEDQKVKAVRAFIAMNEKNFLRTNMSDVIGIPLQVLSRIAENNGLASKGPFKGRNHLRRISLKDQIYTDIDFPPVADLLKDPNELFVEKNFRDRSLRFVDESQQGEEQEKDSPKPMISSESGIPESKEPDLFSEMVESVQTFVRSMSGAKVTNIKITTSDGGKLAFKVGS